MRRASATSAEHVGDEQQLADLDADVEEQQRERDVPFGQADLAQRAGKAEAVQEAERERDEPRRPAVNAFAPAATARTISAATNTMLSAMTASTGADGTCTKPSVASASVMLCATVNAVIVLTSSHVPRVMSTSASTNSRWSMPSRMCSTPSLR